MPFSHKSLLLLSCFLFLTLAARAQKLVFSAAEQQQVSIETAGLFTHSDAFQIDFSIYKDREYSFPLPVGKAALIGGQELEIATERGDAVKAMFDGTVRLARASQSQGNVIVVRHGNGLETVYAHNAQNLVKSGDQVRAGQTIAIVGQKGDQVGCWFAIMANGARINPEMIVDAGSHRLRRQTLLVERRPGGANVTVTWAEKAAETVTRETRAGTKTTTVTRLDLSAVAQKDWCYPLAGGKVISPFGGRRRHAGADIKTCAGDEIHAAFAGTVIRSSPYAAYGNCIVIRHDNGLETLYSHQSKNLVKVGDRVKAGQVIGLTGRTGRATTEHVHFEVKFNGWRLDPAVLFNHSTGQLRRSVLTYKKGVVHVEKRN